jgi:hypothetical protein
MKRLLPFSTVSHEAMSDRHKALFASVDMEGDQGRVIVICRL